MVHRRSSPEHGWPLVGMQPRIIRLRRNVTELEQRITSLEQVLKDDHLCLAFYQNDDDDEARQQERQDALDEITSFYRENSYGLTIPQTCASENATNKKPRDEIYQKTVEQTRKVALQKTESEKSEKTQNKQQKRNKRKENVNTNKCISFHNNNNNDVKIGDKNKEGEKNRHTVLKSKIQLENKEKTNKSYRSENTNRSSEPKKKATTTNNNRQARKKHANKGTNQTKTPLDSTLVHDTETNSSHLSGSRPLEDVKVINEARQSSRRKAGGRKGARKQSSSVLSVLVDCEQPVRDDIFNVKHFAEFLQGRFKVEGKVNNLGTRVIIDISSTSVCITALDLSFPKRYVKYLTKKYLKKKGLRDLIRVVAPSATSSSSSNSSSSNSSNNTSSNSSSSGYSSCSNKSSSKKNVENKHNNTTTSTRHCYQLRYYKVACYDSDDNTTDEE